MKGFCQRFEEYMVSGKVAPVAQGLGGIRRFDHALLADKSVSGERRYAIRVDRASSADCCEMLSRDGGGEGHMTYALMARSVCRGPVPPSFLK